MVSFPDSGARTGAGRDGLVVFHGRESHRLHHVAIVLTWLVMASLCLSCAKQAPGLGDNRDDQRTPALVAMSVEHHKLADIALGQGDRAGAMGQMSALLDQAEQHRVRTTQGYDVTFDAATRLSRMHLEDGDLAAAETAARRGLEGEAEAPATLFRGYLHQVLGDILEKRGDLKGAVDEHGEAIEIFKAILEAKPRANASDDKP